MLEAETTRMMNELIRGIAQHCIDSYKSNQPVAADDLRALAELVSALNVPPEQPPGDPAPVVGFVVSDQADSPGDDE